MPIRFGIADSSELGQRTVLTVTGELDVMAASELGDHVDHAVETEARLVLDLSGVSGVFDGTATALATRSRRLARREGALLVIVRDAVIQQAFEDAGIGRVVHEDQRSEVRQPS